MRRCRRWSDALSGTLTLDANPAQGNPTSMPYRLDLHQIPAAVGYRPLPVAVDTYHGRVQISYGKDSTYLDITDAVLRFCCDGERIRIPGDDVTRALIF